MAKGSWRETAEYAHSEDNPQPHMRPSVGKLVTKLKRLSNLKDHPDAVVYVIQQLAHYSFVHERLRPQQAFDAMQSLVRTWERALGSPHSWDGHEQGNERLLESSQNAVTGDELPKSQSLPMTNEHKLRTVLPGRKFNIFYCTCNEQPEGFAGQDKWEEHLAKHEAEKDRRLQEDQQTDQVIAARQKKRNNTTPGPSHKSPVAYSGTLVGTGFTIPGVEGRFIWHGTSPMMKPPDMDHVIELLTVAEVERRAERRSPQIDLKSKDLKKRVRKVIQNHHLVLDLDNYNSLICNCKEDFIAINEWASHVRKLIWKELQAGGKSD